ncbi:uncharacterized protein LOC129747348 [Uranotaenia lowii]|uniref:uncharacterized protein LOC129747348 n=1 Tax=Uranotaenia lowii TaxID=190385 RepID=UPI0024797FA6|nr:uncharacterized protein LOC129747348 [Uranotaenia lowii]
MATKRAFNILEQRNRNENTQSVSKNKVHHKTDLRAPTKFVLKDLTNSSTSRSQQFAGKQQQKDDLAAFKKATLQPKPSALQFQGKKSAESIVQPTSKKQALTASAFSIFTPEDFEHKRSQCELLREDIFEQALNFHGQLPRREVKPMKPVKIEPLPSFDFEIPKHEVPKSKPLPGDLPFSLFWGLQEVEIPDLEFMF